MVVVVQLCLALLLPMAASAPDCFTEVYRNASGLGLPQGLGAPVMTPNKHSFPFVLCFSFLFFLKTSSLLGYL